MLHGGHLLFPKPFLLAAWHSGSGGGVHPIGNIDSQGEIVWNIETDRISCDGTITIPQSEDASFDEADDDDTDGEEPENGERA